MKVLVTGASGQVGRALVGSVPARVQLQAMTRKQLDISDPDAVRAAVSSFRPEFIINAAAYTAVDRAESDVKCSSAVNALGPRHLAEAAKVVEGCRLLHISTDYVFDGRATEPYKPGDQTNPLSVYGRTKLLGEQAVLEVLGGRVVVLRTAWVYAAQGNNFLSTMLRVMRERGEVRVVADQCGTPTAAASIARAIWKIAGLSQLRGLLHWTDEGSTTWYGFACAIADDAAGAGLLPTRPRVLAIATSQYPTAAKRPANSALDIRESVEKLGIGPLPWRDTLRATLKVLASVKSRGLSPHSL